MFYRHGGRQRDVGLCARPLSDTIRQRGGLVLIDEKKSVSPFTRHGQLGTGRGRGRSVEEADGSVPAKSRGTAGVHRMQQGR